MSRQGLRTSHTVLLGSCSRPREAWMLVTGVQIGLLAGFGASTEVVVDPAPGFRLGEWEQYLVGGMQSALLLD